MASAERAGLNKHMDATGQAFVANAVMGTEGICSQTDSRAACKCRLVPLLSIIAACSIWNMYVCACIIYTCVYISLSTTGLSSSARCTMLEAIGENYLHVLLSVKRGCLESSKIRATHCWFCSCQKDILTEDQVFHLMIFTIHLHLHQVLHGSS